MHGPIDLERAWAACSLRALLKNRKRLLKKTRAQDG